MNALNLAIAKKVKSYVEEHKKFPSSITIDGVKYNYGTFTEILANTVVNTNSVYTKKSYKDAPAPTGSSISKVLTKNEYIKLAREIVQFYNTNKRCPNYVSYQNYKISPKLFSYCFAKIIVFYIQNKRYPTTCEFKSSVFTNTTSSAKYTTKGGKVCKQLMNLAKISINNYKDVYKAMSKIFTYDYYYDDVQTQSQTISRRKGNCTDLNQIERAALLELYSKDLVQIVRGLVRCNDGKTYGHVWCRIKVNGKWINIDASAAAKGKSLGSVICASVVEITNINPSWAVSDDGKT